MSQVETAGVAGHYHYTDLPHEELVAQIDRLRQEKNAVILAHNYQVPEVQDIADFTGDSLGLSVEASRTAADLIVFCGVHFMAESAKILSPEKTVLLPHLGAGCALSDSITPESLEEWKEAYPDHTVVTYVNSSAEVKAESDICCTSANAVSVVRSLDSGQGAVHPGPQPRPLGGRAGAGEGGGDLRRRLPDPRRAAAGECRAHPGGAPPKR